MLRKIFVCHIGCCCFRHTTTRGYMTTCSNRLSYLMVDSFSTMKHLSRSVFTWMQLASASEEVLPLGKLVDQNHNDYYNCKCGSNIPSGHSPGYFHHPLRIFHPCQCHCLLATNIPVIYIFQKIDMLLH